MTKFIYKIGTEFEFEIGDAINPGWEELHQMMRALWNEHLGPTLLPDYVDEAILVAGNKQQLEALVVYLCQEIDHQLRDGHLALADHPRLHAIVYVLFWYWHRRLGGPRPPQLTKRRYVKKVEIYQRTQLGCPFCLKPFEPHPRFKKASVKAKLWRSWLKRHFAEYHKWKV